MIMQIFTQLSQALSSNPAIALLASFMWGMLSVLLSPCHLAIIGLLGKMLGDLGGWTEPVMGLIFIIMAFVAGLYLILKQFIPILGDKMIIKILGTGCPKCKKLEENSRQAIQQAGIEAVVEKVTDLDKIMDYGVMLTPALMIDEKVVSSGKLPSVEDIKQLIGKGM